MNSSRLSILSALISGIILSGCAATGSTESKMADAKPLNNDDYYEVHHEGRIHIFDDAETYLSYLEVGETSFRKVYIGEGPKGETLVFGLTSGDKKKSSGIASIDMYHNKLSGADDFYGEIEVEGRIYVFSAWADLQSFKEVGEAVFRYTDIGSGPDGKSVVYVLNKGNKKHKPEALIAKFKTLHGLK